MNVLDFIITHRSISQERSENLEFILKWINALNVKSNIILIEQDSNSLLKIDFLKYNTKHIFAKNSNLFCKSWGMNIGIKNSNNDNIAFCDSDCFLEVTNMNLFLNEFINGNYDYGTPNMQCHMTNELDRRFLLKTVLHENIRCMHKPIAAPTIFPTTGGIFCAKRSAINKIKWWDEDFVGWGKEDNAMSVKFRAHNMKLWRKDYMLYHLWHPVDFSSDYKSKNIINNNLERYQKFYGNYSKAIKTINDTDINLLGNVLKYS